MEIEMKHWSHKHPMVLKKAKEIETLVLLQHGDSDETSNDDDDDDENELRGYIFCYGCLSPISGPFYSCKEEAACEFGCYEMYLCKLFKKCATSDGEDDDEDDDDVNTKHLPVMRNDWTTFISSIFEKVTVDEVEDDETDNEIDHFSHDHLLQHLHDGKWNDNVCEKVCEACAEPILGPSYGCTRCNYFLHEWCSGLPEQISHEFHPEHDIKIFAQYPNRVATFRCDSCHQMCNTFGYKCDECDFLIDVKCVFLSGRIKHEAHKHTLSSNTFKRIECSACGSVFIRVRKCETERCSFNLCLRCTRLPPIVNHRYCKCQGLSLQYFPVKNYNFDYYCDLCEGKLNPQYWFYHCGACDQSAHTYCLIDKAEDSNIKFGKRYNFPDQHEHELILTRFTYEYSNCKICVSSLNKEFAVGFECATCPYFKIHLECVPEES